MNILVKDELYLELIDLLKEIKLTQGNMALNSTLRRHPKVYKYIFDNQVNNLSILEDSVKLELESK